MILREHFRDLREGDVEILASDLSEAMIERAREGSFSQFEINRGLPADHLREYFVRVGSRWRIRDDLRASIRFERRNLIEEDDGSLPVFDLILLRNVVLYFDRDAKRRVLERMKTVLRPEGYLILGSTETTHGLDDAFRRDLVGRAVVYRPVS